MSDMTPPVPPTIPDGIAVYDAIMTRIEPELVSVNLSRLDVVAANDGITERRARQQRYRSAWRRYEIEYGRYVSKLNADVRRFQRQIRLYAEVVSRSRNDDGRLHEIETAFH